MVGCANPESGLRLFVQSPDRKRRHDSNASSASEDCKGHFAHPSSVQIWIQPVLEASLDRDAGVPSVFVIQPYLDQGSERVDLQNCPDSRILRATRNLRDRSRIVTPSRNSDKQNITISLSRNVLRKAKILAARRETSVSGLLAHQIESLVGEDQAYERAERQAMALLEKGFSMGGLIRASRDELHER